MDTRPIPPHDETHVNKSATGSRDRSHVGPAPSRWEGVPYLLLGTLAAVSLASRLVLLFGQ